MARWGRENAKSIILASRRKTLHKMQRGRCAYCNESVALDDSTVDHKQPLSRGGTHAMHNLCMACEECNRRKGSMTAEEFERSRR